MYRNFGITLLLIFLVSCGPKVVKKEPVPAKEEEPSLPQAWVIKEAVNVREEGTTNAPVVTTLNDGDKVYLIKNKGGWYKIRYAGNELGWVRSDLVGPRYLSRTILARTFVDSILPALNAEMYFDKDEPFRIIYLIIPESDYSSKSRAAQKAREIGRVYQEKVYPGDLEIRIMNPDAQKELFMKIQLEAVSLPDTPVPIIEYGRLHTLDTPDFGEVRLWVLVPDSLSNEKGLEMARSISSIYAYPYTKAEIFLVENSPEGRNYLQDPDVEKISEPVIKLYYLEDKDGEYYQFGVSGEIPAPYQ